MKVTAPPGAHPGQLPYAVVNKTNKQAQRPANQTLKALAPKHPKKLSRIPPFACAWGVAFAGWRWHRRVPVHRQLACRVCPNGALSARREFRGTPRKRHGTGCPSQREGSQQQGRPSFGYFSWPRKKSTSPAGARPGQPPYAVVNKTNKQAQRPANQTQQRRRHQQRQNRTKNKNTNKKNRGQSPGPQSHQPDSNAEWPALLPSGFNACAYASQHRPSSASPAASAQSGYPQAQAREQRTLYA